MNRNQIISSLYRDKDINTAIGKMNPEELREDLKSEMFLVLCEMDEKRLLRAYEEGYIKYFLVRTMLNMIKSDRSTFYKLFRGHLAEFMDYHSKSTTNDIEEQEGISKKLTDALDGLAWYEREILKLYADRRNIVQMSRETKIPYRSLFNTLTIAKQKMKQAFKKEPGRQAKLIGNYVTASLDLVVDVSTDLNPDELADLLEQISVTIREKVAGASVQDATINHITDLKIKTII